MTPFTYSIHTQLEDTDMGGVVYHSNFLNYMERARSMMLSAKGLTAAQCMQHGFYFVVRSLQIEYLKPIPLHHDITVSCEVVATTATSMTFSQQIYDAKVDDCTYASATVKIVCINQKHRPIRLPEILKECINHE